MNPPWNAAWLRAFLLASLAGASACGDKTDRAAGSPTVEAQGVSAAARSDVTAAATDLGVAAADAQKEVTGDPDVPAAPQSAVEHARHSGGERHAGAAESQQTAHAALAPESADPAPAAAPHASHPVLARDGRVGSVAEYFATLSQRFRPAAAKGLHAVFQFELTGPGGGAYHVRVDDGAMRLEHGTTGDATATIRADAAEYVKVVNGEVNGASAVLGGKMKVGGDLIVARRMQEIFPPAR